MNNNSRPPRRYWQALVRPHWTEIGLAVALIVVGGVVGGAQICIYLRQADIMQTQADIAKRQNEISVATQRAFINFEPFDVVSIDTSPGGPGRVVGISFNVMNSGNVPTKEFKAVTKCTSLPAAETRTEPFDLFKWEEDKIVIDVIGPKQKSGINTCNVNPNDIREIESGGLVMYLLAEVTYSDRIDPSSPHKTRLSQQFFVSGVHFDDKSIAHFHWNTEPKGRNNCADEDCK